MYRAIICYQAVRMQGSGEVEMKTMEEKNCQVKGCFRSVQVWKESICPVVVHVDGILCVIRKLNDYKKSGVYPCTLF